jgi:hypothetical protein
MTMQIITGKHIPRRTFIRGMGATVALPFLDAMIPAGSGRRGSVAAEIDARTRLVCIEEVHGVPGCNEWGASQHLFAPETIGRDFEMNSLNVLKSLEPFQDYLTIISNTDVRMAEAYEPGEIGGDHFRSTAVFLTQSHPKQTQGSDIYVGASMDQMHARRFGQDTAIPSLQLCIENLGQGGGCWYNYHCAYTDAVSWASPSEPLPMIRDPRAAFDLLFGAGGSSEERAVRRRTNQSILDWIVEEVVTLKRRLGTEDSNRLDKYLENVQEVERRIRKVEAFNTSGEARELPEAPSGVPDSFSEHMEIMFDLQVLAFQTDMTRVVSFKTGRDASNRIHPESGTTTPFHPASHHGEKEEAILDFNKIAQYRLSPLPYFLEKLKGSMEGDTHLLDKTAIVWGSPMSDGNLHNHRRCPLIVLGHANGQLEGNLHLKAPDGTPMANAFLDLLHRLGHDDMESFGDSSGVFELSANGFNSVTAAEAS